MSSHYTTEPPPTASVLLHTTAGSIQISLFATQTPLTSRNFLQHILDGYYDLTPFHRVIPGFVIQGGDPTGTGEGGESIYEDREFEIDARSGEKVVFGDEVHSRLKFNRRGLVGMAKMGESSYGSQFFITLADVRAQFDGDSTMFGRVEGDGIYNVVRIAEAENVEGTERPMYPFKITGAEILEMPKGEPWASMKKRERTAKRTAPQDEEIEGKVKKKAKTKKKGKTLLSFEEEDGEGDTGPIIQPKAKFNTRLLDSLANKETSAANGQLKSSSGNSSGRPAEEVSQDSRSEKEPQEKKKPARRRSSPSPPARSQPTGSSSTSKFPEAHRRKPSFHDSTTQLPLKDPESPSRSPSRSATVSPEPPSKPSASFTLNAEIAALKASMRHRVTPALERIRKKSALEQLIPETSIRGRKRPRPGNSGGSNNNDRSALKILNAFKARLEGADRAGLSAQPSLNLNGQGRTNGVDGILNRQPKKNAKKHGLAIATVADDDDDEEATLCDLHFIVNCQSCSNWDNPPVDPTNPNTNTTDHHPPLSNDDDDAESTDWMSHALSFEKDRLGKDLTWKRKNEEELVVIDPREKERDMDLRGSAKRERGKEREWGGRGR